MPVRHARSETRGRPPHRRRGRTGKNARRRSESWWVRRPLVDRAASDPHPLQWQRDRKRTQAAMNEFESGAGPPQPERSRLLP
jgi:hypothetical protein